MADSVIIDFESDIVETLRDFSSSFYSKQRGNLILEHLGSLIICVIAGYNLQDCIDAFEFFIDELVQFSGCVDSNSYNINIHKETGEYLELPVPPGIDSTSVIQAGVLLLEARQSRYPDQDFEYVDILKDSVSQNRHRYRLDELFTIRFSRRFRYIEVS